MSLRRGTATASMLSIAVIAGFTLLPDTIATDSAPVAIAPDSSLEPATDATTTTAITRSPESRYGTEPPGNWAVTAVDTGDHLNIRAEPTTNADVIGHFRFDATDIDSTGRVAITGETTWREIKVLGATTGWVAARYLSPMTPDRPSAPPRSGTEPSFEREHIDGRTVCDTFGEVDEGPGTSH